MSLTIQYAITSSNGGGGFDFFLQKHNNTLTYNMLSVFYTYPPPSPKKEKLEFLTKFKWPLNECEYRTK